MAAVVKAIVLGQWRSAAMEQAQRQGLEVAGIDWLLRELAGIDRLQLRLAHPQDDLPLRCPFETIVQHWQQHCEHHVPLQYLVGWTTWRNLHLRVAPGVLIPRPETELLVDIALTCVQQEPSLAEGEWVDLGTGSGAIPIALALEAPSRINLNPLNRLNLHGVDCSPDALTIAQENARQNGLTPVLPANTPTQAQTPTSTSTQTVSLQWHLGSWFTPFTPPQRKISVMLSNPPYIPTAEIQRLAPTVRNYEPQLALDGGADGLQAIEHLIHTASDYLRPGGLWLVEIMAGQGAIVQAKLAATGHYDRICLYPDLAGIDRFVMARTVG